MERINKTYQTFTSYLLPNFNRILKEATLENLQAAIGLGGNQVLTWTFECTKTGQKYSAVHLAVHLCNAGILQQLLELGADVDERNEIGYTPLHRLFIEAEDNCPERQTTLKVLISHNANPCLKDNQDQTPLELALSALPEQDNHLAPSRKKCLIHYCFLLVCYVNLQHLRTNKPDEVCAYEALEKQLLNQALRNNMKKIKESFGFYLLDLEEKNKSRHLMIEKQKMWSENAKKKKLTDCSSVKEWHRTQQLFEKARLDSACALEKIYQDEQKETMRLNMYLNIFFTVYGLEMVLYLDYWQIEAVEKVFDAFLSHDPEIWKIKNINLQLIEMSKKNSPSYLNNQASSSSCKECLKIKREAMLNFCCVS